MSPINKIKMIKFRPNLLGMNPKLAVNIYPENLFTVLQWSEKLPDPLVFINK